MTKSVNYFLSLEAVFKICFVMRSNQLTNEVLAEKTSLPTKTIDDYLSRRKSATPECYALIHQALGEHYQVSFLVNNFPDPLYFFDSSDIPQTILEHDLTSRVPIRFHVPLSPYFGAIINLYDRNHTPEYRSTLMRSLDRLLISFQQME